MNAIKTKKSDTSSAAIAAVAIHKMLRNAGCAMSEPRPTGWTEGLQVFPTRGSVQAGRGSVPVVTVIYHLTSHNSWSVRIRMRVQDAVNKAKRLLRDAGYHQDRFGRVVCEKE